MASEASSPPSSSLSASAYLFGLVRLGAILYASFVFLDAAYHIRLFAIEEFGPVIHEFDPYFNYRATEYLYEHGREKFFKWFDYMSWYPLGRPVGTTIYPGMQLTAVFLKNHIVGDRMSLNDVCCYMPSWFGVLSSFLVGCIAYECSLPQNCNTNLVRIIIDAIKGTRSDAAVDAKKTTMFGLSTPAAECGVFAMGMMAVVPAHLMRSIGGGYDNESVAVTAMTLTFCFWIRSLRSMDDYSSLYGILAGIAYFYMVAAWGGYTFVLNMVGVHAALLVAFGRFSTKCYTSYSLFYVIGTALAIRIPVVGLAPLKSLEQLGPLFVFLGYQALQVCEVIRRKQNLSRKNAWKLRVRVFAGSAAVGLLLMWILLPSGYFGPISSRVRGLFVQHTKTGNPLVDSVAEHQRASTSAYFQYLQHLCTAAPLGFLMVTFNLGDASSFLLAWGGAAYFFSNKMVRLILLTGPIASTLGGIAAGRIFAWCLCQLWEGDEEEAEKEGAGGTPTKGKKGKKAAENGGKADGKKKRAGKKGQSSSKSSFAGVAALTDAFRTASKSKEGIILKRTVACVIVLVMYLVGLSFKAYSWKLGKALSNPTIIVKGQMRDGTIVKVDDYREAYWWLRDNTPSDSRIMAWWDYGYQITAIANRTTLADGNTWNHEHIALLGKALTTREEEGYEIARHLADYVLVWGGGGGDDLAKSPHLARIANSVYRDMCPGDPTCRGFGFVDRQGTPSKMMERSLLYRLHGHKTKPGVEADPNKFREVFRSKYGKVRIFKILGVSKESKDWNADPANRVCDAPGSWFCAGQYPPGLRDVLAHAKDFAQLEDFNREDSDEDYQKEYFDALANPELAKAKARAREIAEMKEQAEKGPAESAREAETLQQGTPPSQEEIDAVYNKWEDSEEATLMWKIISSGAVNDLNAWIAKDPLAAFVRSSDGRGPMWWAFENRNQEIVKILMKAGVGHTDKDKYGKTPVDLLDGSM